MNVERLIVMKIEFKLYFLFLGKSYLNGKKQNKKNSKFVLQAGFQSNMKKKVLLKKTQKLNNVVVLLQFSKLNQTVTKNV